MLFAPRKRIIFHVESIATNIDRFYAKYGVYNYASKSVYIEESCYLYTFYAEKTVLGTHFVEKLWERIENLSDLRENLSVSFQNLSVTVATDSPKNAIGRI